MAVLKNSRGKFFEAHRMPRDRSFWNYYFDRIGRLSKLPQDQVAALSAWTPERSNCPGLTVITEDLIERFPVEWRSLADNIFVGRVLDGEVNSQAWASSKAAIVEINLQYSYAVSAYVATFDEYRETITNLLKIVLDESNTDELIEALNARLLKPWSWLDESRPEWLDFRLLS